MSFVIITDFDEKPYSLSNLDKVTNTFNAFIALQEAETMRMMFGQSFYEEIVTNTSPPSGIWESFVSGANYD